MDSLLSLLLPYAPSCISRLQQSRQLTNKTAATLIPELARSFNSLTEDVQPTLNVVNSTGIKPQTVRYTAYSRYREK